MAVALNTYKVHFHFEASAGVAKKVSGDYMEYVQAAAGDESTIQAVLNSNNKQFGPGTRKISSVQMVSPTATIA